MTPGETLRVRVGGTSAVVLRLVGGYNGGGTSGQTGAGGGATDVRQGGDTLSIASLSQAEAAVPVSMC